MSVDKPGGERQALTVFAGTNLKIMQGARVLGSVIGSSGADKHFQPNAKDKCTKIMDGLCSISSHLSPECLCLFDEGGSAEVELPLAYYTFHGRGFGQGGGAAWPSHTEHRRREIIQKERKLFSLPLRMGGLNITIPKDLHRTLEQSIELSSPLPSFNNDSFEFQQCELGQTKISLTESRHAM